MKPMVWGSLAGCLLVSSIALVEQADGARVAFSSVAIEPDVEVFTNQANCYKTDVGADEFSVSCRATVRIFDRTNRKAINCLLFHSVDYRRQGGSTFEAIRKNESAGSCQQDGEFAVDPSDVLTDVSLEGPSNPPSFGSVYVTYNTRTFAVRACINGTADDAFADTGCADMKIVDRR